MEMSTRNLPWAKGQPAYKADFLISICEPIAKKNVTSLWASMTRYRDTLKMIPNM
jgi:hypothetical protein